MVNSSNRIFKRNPHIEHSNDFRKKNLPVLFLTMLLFSQGVLCKEWTQQENAATNGGSTWGTQTSGTGNSLRSVRFADGSTGWIVGGLGTILSTTDGGLSWSSQASGTSNILYSVCFTDPSTGWAVGSSGTIVHSADGGATWLSQSSGTVFDLNGVSFTDANTGCAVGSSGTVIHTTDGGASWLPQTSGTLHHLGAVHFTDSQTGWAVGHFGTILHTTNGGSTWLPQTSGTEEYLEGVHLTDSNTGWAVGTNGTILHTTNGGSIWSVQTNGIMVSFFSVYFTDSNNGWVVGSDLQTIGVCYILHTTDGGTTWLPQATGTSEWLSAVCFTDSHTGWAVGTNGTILHTTTGGTGVEPPTPPTLLLPESGSSVSKNPVLSWNPSAGALWYTLQVSSSPYFTTTVFNQTDIENTSYQVGELDPEATYYWRVSLTDATGTSGWSEVWHFATTSVPCDAISFLNAKCNANGAAQAMVRMLNSTEYAGEIVEFQLDDTVYPVELITNGTHTIGRLQVRPAGFGQHTITLTNPAGCFDPVTFNCQVDAPHDPEWDALWAEYEALEAQALETLSTETRTLGQPDFGLAGQPVLGLAGNYPNPFNPSTTIRYALRVDSPVSLRVYNMLGQEVATLVDAFQKAGEQVAVWRGVSTYGQSVASGLYVYRLQAGNTVMTQKMLFTK